jgi:hypothetical protein
MATITFPYKRLLSKKIKLFLNSILTYNTESVGSGAHPGVAYAFQTGLGVRPPDLPYPALG